MEEGKAKERNCQDIDGNPITREVLQKLGSDLVIRTKRGEARPLNGFIIPLDCEKCGFHALKVNGMSFNRHTLDLLCPCCGDQCQRCLKCGKTDKDLFKHKCGVVIYIEYIDKDNNK